MSEAEKKLSIKQTTLAEFVELDIAVKRSKEQLNEIMAKIKGEYDPNLPSYYDGEPDGEYTLHDGSILCVKTYRKVWRKLKTEKPPKKLEEFESEEEEEEELEEEDLEGIVAEAT